MIPQLDTIHLKFIVENYDSVTINLEKRWNDTNSKTNDRWRKQSLLSVISSDYVISVINAYLF